MTINLRIRPAVACVAQRSALADDAANAAATVLEGYVRDELMARETGLWL
jgi:hypothetical protein